MASLLNAVYQFVQSSQPLSSTRLYDETQWHLELPAAFMQAGLPALKTSWSRFMARRVEFQDTVIAHLQAQASALRPLLEGVKQDVVVLVTHHHLNMVLHMIGMIISTAPNLEFVHSVAKVLAGHLWMSCVL